MSKQKTPWKAIELQIVKDCYPDLWKARKMMNGKHSLSSILSYAACMGLKGRKRQPNMRWTYDMKRTLMEVWGDDEKLMENFPGFTYQSLKSKASRMGLNKKRDETTSN